MLDAADLDNLATRIAERLRADRDRLLTIAELADRLQMHMDSVRRLVRRGELPQPLLRTGGSVRWHWPQVRRHLLARQGRRRRGGRGRRATT